MGEIQPATLQGIYRENFNLSDEFNPQPCRVEFGGGLHPGLRGKSVLSFLEIQSWCGFRGRWFRILGGANLQTCKPIFRACRYRDPGTLAPLLHGRQEGPIIFS